VEDLDVDGRSVLKWVLKKKSRRVLTGQESVVSSSDHDNEILGCLYRVGM